jgi:hypothetical protein
MVAILNCFDGGADAIIERYESEFYNNILKSKKIRNESGIF